MRLKQKRVQLESHTRRSFCIKYSASWTAKTVKQENAERITIRASGDFKFNLYCIYVLYYSFDSLKCSSYY